MAIARSTSTMVLILAAVVFVALIPLAYMGAWQRKAVDVMGRHEIEHDMREIRALQQRQQRLIDMLVQKRGAAVLGGVDGEKTTQGAEKGKAKRLGADGKIDEKVEFVHRGVDKEVNDGVTERECKNKFPNCPNWSNCCPGEEAETNACSKEDCSDPDKPCEGLFMKKNCPETCRLCPRQIEEDAKLPQRPPLLTIWDRTNEDSGSLVSLPTVSWRKWHVDHPRVVAADNVLTEEECATVRALAKPSLKRSKVVHPGNSSEGLDSVRTSSGMWIHKETPEVAKIRAAVSELVGKPKAHFEALQILKYEPGEKYVHHSDFFEAHMKEYIGTAGNRIATAIVFLNSIPEGEGGETGFPYARPVPVKFTPKAGSAVLFYNIQRNGKVDRKSEHEAVPPKAGQEKWVAVTWVREHPFR